MIRTFEEIRDEVYNLPNTDEELLRLDEELELFEERGWNQYIAFAVNYLREMNEKVKFFFPSLSVMDSLFVNKAIHPDYNYDKLLSKQYSKGVLFNDALRLGVDIVYADPNELGYLNQLAALIFREFLRMSHLHADARAIPDKDKVGFAGKLVSAISPNFIPKEDMDVIVNEKSDGPRDEINILSKYLIVYVTCKVGI